MIYLLQSNKNYRGEFTFSVIEETKLEWRGTEISLSDLDVGNNISLVK